ncbi:uncharacterized protein LOC131221494 isoform X2 [Magnolia sinica]|uniref:uncharacterized protein LOC131221494 isoform X2 n=1 Tax=Magnolia sinica TaxID=86752 RepID=UPI002659758C|nr:uncharacterized protein LOC131221494 isoform X2 [Magnolia sinica]XP_058072751.1 uncharacterized protein LOC131221494 isoform X2 [Magnolia sinica]XP_058072752.1 uncharacterized protein LOC131221494 isoform X2 [Magnolia sinica]
MFVCRSRALSTKYNSLPNKSSQPFETVIEMNLSPSIILLYQLQYHSPMQGMHPFQMDTDTRNATYLNPPAHQDIPKPSKGVIMPAKDFDQSHLNLGLQALLQPFHVTRA